MWVIGGVHVLFQPHRYADSGFCVGVCGAFGMPDRLEVLDHLCGECRDRLRGDGGGSGAGVGLSGGYAFRGAEGGAALVRELMWDVILDAWGGDWSRMRGPLYA